MTETSKIKACYGFRYRDVDKITAVSSDGEPEKLGKIMLEFCKDRSLTDMRKIYDNIYLRSPRRTPFKKDIRACFSAGFCPETKNKRNLASWKYLLQNCTSPYAYSNYKDGLLPMVDHLDLFIHSEKTDYAYIIDIDTKVLEFWMGHQKESNIFSRYYAIKKPKFAQCSLKLRIPFGFITDSTISSLVEKMRIVEKY